MVEMTELLPGRPGQPGQPLPPRDFERVEDEFAAYEFGYDKGYEEGNATGRITGALYTLSLLGIAILLWWALTMIPHT